MVIIMGFVGCKSLFTMLSKLMEVWCFWLEFIQHILDLLDFFVVLLYQITFILLILLHFSRRISKHVAILSLGLFIWWYLINAMIVMTDIISWVTVVKEY